MDQKRWRMPNSTPVESRPLFGLGSAGDAEVTNEARSLLLTRATVVYSAVRFYSVFT